MDRGDPDFLERLFERARALPPEEQEAFLEEACAGDPAAEAELRSLIAAARSAEGFFDSLADAVVSLSPWARGERESLSPETDGPDPLIGRSVHQYRIENLLGRGGMGVVYGAHDTTLDRPVALKFLPRHVTDDEEAAERFLVEARAAAALDHPNVCTVHEIGESEDGRRFIAMAYCEGETLKQKIAAGPLPIEEAKEYARQMAAALEAAHKHDIVHRDIKPGNAIVSPEGLVKVLDFGLAKLADVTLTRTGSTMGTVAYMSPEQIRARDVDHRTDLWSLGVVLYEMLTGERPFKGDSNAVVIHAIQEEEPEPPSALRPEVEPELEAVVGRLLAKDPEARYQSAAGVRYALGEPRPLVQVIGSRWRWIGLGAAAAAAGIAILLASPARTVFESDGALLAEPVVKPWTIVAEFEGSADPTYLNVYRDAVMVQLEESTIVQPCPPGQIQLGIELAELPDTVGLRGSLAREIAQRGSIRTVVWGKLDQVGNTFSVVLRLEDAETGAAMWSDQVVVPEEDELVPAFIELADRLRTELGERRQDVRASRLLVQVRTGSLQAFQKYNESLRVWHDERNAAESKRLVQEALAFDPEMGAAWLQLRRMYNQLRQYDSVPYAFEQARRYKDRMTEAESWELEYMESATLQDRLAALERALEANPNDLRLYERLAYLSGPLRETQEQRLELLNRADSISPFGLYQEGHRIRTDLLILLGRTEEARESVIQVKPESMRRRYLWLAALRDTDWAAAESLAVEPDYTRTLADPGPEDIGTTAGAWVALHTVRGEIRAAREWIARARVAMREAREISPPYTNRIMPRWTLDVVLAERYLDMVTGALPAANDSTCFDVPLQGDQCSIGAGAAVMIEALAKDTVATRHAVRSFTADTFTQPEYLRYWQTRDRHRRWSTHYPIAIIPDWVRMVLASLAGDWGNVVQAGESVLDAPTGGFGTPVTRWMVADASEKLERFERAAELFELFTRVPSWGRNIEGAGIFYSFAHRRLARIHTQLGDNALAIEHWTTFLDAFTRPDPEYEWMVEEGRAELERLRRS